MSKNYWLKPLGLPDHWIGKDDFSDFSEKIDFPAPPSSIKIGDWIFLYAVGHQKLMGIFEVTSGFSEFSPEEKEDPKFIFRKQFPYYLEAKNVFKIFSLHWPAVALNPNILDDDFSKKTGYSVTPTNDSINAIQHGKSHIRLTKEFAQFLLDSMLSVQLPL